MFVSFALMEATLSYVITGAVRKRITLLVLIEMRRFSAQRDVGIVVGTYVVIVKRLPNICALPVRIHCARLASKKLNFHVLGNKGFCQTCLKTVMLVEKNEQGDYDDKTSWEFLFKDYWLDLKRNLSLTLNELTQASNSSKSSGVSARKEESSDEAYNVNTDQRSDSDGGSGCPQVAATPKKRKSKRKSKLFTKEDVSSSAAGSDGHSMVDENEWASNELLEFVAHMKNGNASIFIPV